MGERDMPAGAPPVPQAAADPDHAVVASAEAAISAERARISRELHDIVSHSVTVMVLLAAGARRVMDTTPERARTALAQIEQTGTHAMEELGRMLQVLRTGRQWDEPGRDGVGRPGLGEVYDLLAGVRAAGIKVDLQVQGEPRGVAPSVGIAAYRVVQEALTNITRHDGPGARATVRIAWADELLVEIRDDGGGVPQAEVADRLSTGHGLAGLAERVAVAGGRLEAGQLPAGGGFRVAATLPVCGHRRCVAPRPAEPRPAEPRPEPRPAEPAPAPARCEGPQRATGARLRRPGTPGGPV